MSARVAAVVVAVGLVGCGSGQGRLSGRVTFGGKPVVYGTVVVIGSDGLAQHGTIQPDGRYEVAGVCAGPATVWVTSPKPPDGEPAPAPGRDGRPRRADAMRSERNNDAAGIAVPADVSDNWQRLPDRYADPGESKLHVTINRGANTWDIALD